MLVKLKPGPVLSHSMIMPAFCRLACFNQFKKRLKHHDDDEHHLERNKVEGSSNAHPSSSSF